MGLEGVELVLSIEEEFGIEIDDADAANLVTPRMLADYVVGRLGEIASPRGSCLSQAGFYRLRAILVREFGAARNDVRPQSPIRGFLQGSIRTQWRRLQRAVDAGDFPRLQCRRAIAYPLQTGLPAAGCAILASAGAPGWGLVTGSFALCLAAAIACDKLSDVVPERAGTVGALVPYAVSRKPKEEWSTDYVLQRVICLSAVQLGLPADAIQPDHHYVKDLGLDS